MLGREEVVVPPLSADLAQSEVAVEHEAGRKDPVTLFTPARSQHARTLRRGAQLGKFALCAKLSCICGASLLAALLLWPVVLLGFATKLLGNLVILCVAVSRLLRVGIKASGTEDQ